MHLQQFIDLSLHTMLCKYYGHLKMAVDVNTRVTQPIPFTDQIVRYLEASEQIQSCLEELVLCMNPHQGHYKTIDNEMEIVVA